MHIRFKVRNLEGKELWFDISTKTILQNEGNTLETPAQIGFWFWHKERKDFLKAQITDFHKEKHKTVFKDVNVSKKHSVHCY